MSETGTVYVLVDPRNGGIRYVGATIRPLNARLSGHLSGKPVSPAMGKWIGELKAAGLRPTITAVLENVPKGQLAAEESDAIRSHSKAGWYLLNTWGKWDGAGVGFRLRRLEKARLIGGETLEEAERELAVAYRVRRSTAERHARWSPSHPDMYPRAIRIYLAEYRQSLDPEGMRIAHDVILAMVTVAASNGFTFHEVMTSWPISRIVERVQSSRTNGRLSEDAKQVTYSRTMGEIFARMVS